MRKRVPVLVLGSGGIDSAALIHRYHATKESIRVIHFQYGQPSGRSELGSLKAVCKYYGAKIDVVELGFKPFTRGFESLGRNAIFTIVASSIGLPPSRIGIGIHKGTNYYDCSKTFVMDLSKAPRWVFWRNGRPRGAICGCLKGDNHQVL